MYGSSPQGREHAWRGYHIQNVNAYASSLKTRMVRFRGVATKYFDSYLGWRRMIDRDGEDATRPTIPWPPSHRLLRQQEQSQRHSQRLGDIEAHGSLLERLTAHNAGSAG